jgi:hypothetical protein
LKPQVCPASSELQTLLLDILPDDDEVPVKQSKHRRLKEPLGQEMGPALLEHVVDEWKKPAQKHPILARFKITPEIQ